VSQWYSEKFNSVDLSGSWELKFEVKKSSLKRFEEGSLQYKYRISLVQEGNNITGKGEKFWEMISGKESYYGRNAKTPIEIDGVSEAGNLKATIREQGTRRVTNGSIDLSTMTSEDSLSGTFYTQAANSSGTASMHRIK